MSSRWYRILDYFGLIDEAPQLPPGEDLAKFSIAIGLAIICIVLAAALGGWWWLPGILGACVSVVLGAEWIDRGIDEADDVCYPESV
jgi:hypothetical protein